MRSALPNVAADVNVSGRTYVKNRVTQLEVPQTNGLYLQ